MRRIATTAILAAGLGLAACGPINRGLESVHQPVVQRTDYVFDVATDGGAGLAGGESERLADWFDSIQLRYGDRVSVDDRGSYGSGRNGVASVAARYGLLLDNAAPVTANAPEAGRARVVVSRSTAQVPNCPDWSGWSQPNFTASTSPNFGCASNRNLAAMVANPEDLVRGQDTVNSDARTVAKALKSYRDARPTGTKALKQETTGGAN